MADIEHRNIPDAELHKVKGAVSAPANTVLTADGIGDTTFKKVDVSMLSGTIPTNVPNMVITTNGTGGLTYNTPTYGRFTLTGTTMTAGTYQGFTVAGANFKPNVSGLYWFSTESPVFTAPSTLSWPILRNVTTVTVVSPGLSGLVYLENIYNYSLSTDGNISLWKVNT